MAWVEIDRKNAPASNMFDFSSLTLTGYEVIQVIASGITVTTDATDINLTFYVGGAEQTGATTYRWLQYASSTGGTGNLDGDASDPSIRLNSNDANFDVGNAAEKAFSSIITIDKPTNTAIHKRAAFVSSMTGPTGNAIVQQGLGVMANAGAIDGLKISGTSNLTAGAVIILGLEV
jgi:hypothetical protein